jgi:hypothetical protein
LTFLGTQSGAPNWSPDGQYIAFDSFDEGHTQIYTINTNGLNQKKITRDKSNNHIPSWSRDGKWIYFRSDRSGIEQIWRIPVEGGSAEQITFNGGQSAFESFDGKWIYYSNDNGIWKKSLQGGEEKLIINEWVGWRGWVLVDDGIYYADWRETGYEAKFYSFKTGNVTEISKLEQYLWTRGLCVSPDQHWLLYTKYEQSEADIILIENFR